MALFLDRFEDHPAMDCNAVFLKQAEMMAAHSKRGKKRVCEDSLPTGSGGAAVKRHMVDVQGTPPPRSTPQPPDHPPAKRHKRYRFIAF